MESTPYTSDLDLASVTTREELAALLVQVRLRADQPSLRALEARTRHGPTPLSKTVVSEMLKGGRLPRKAVMVAFLGACGVPVDQLELWRRTWDKIASSKSGPTETGESKRLRQELDRLQVENEQLRLKLAKIDRRSIWRFPDNSEITLVSCRLPSHLLAPHADPGYQNYIRFSSLADLDTVIDIHGEIRSYNPTSVVAIMAAQDLTWAHVKTHLVVIGGLTWETVSSWFSRDLLIPIQAEDPAHRGAIVVRNPDGGEREFQSRLGGGGYTEDVGFFVRGRNPADPLLTLTICGGVTTRGVQGAAQCFIDSDLANRNEQYLTRFPEGSTYCIVMRVEVVNQNIRTPDLSNAGDRLFEWCDPRPSSVVPHP